MRNRRFGNGGQATLYHLLKEFGDAHAGDLICFVSLLVGRSYGQVATVPERTDDNLIVAAYNIQFFGDKAHDNKKLAEVI